MERKRFLQSLIPAGSICASIGSLDAYGGQQDPQTLLVPSYLKQGDTIGILCLSGFVKKEAVQPAVQQLEAWGFRILLGDTIGKKDGSLGGTDAERLNDLHQMIRNPKIKAILSARGGYGLIRILDQIDLTLLKKHPKWILGFSDVTSLHCHLNRKLGLASIHSKMCNSFPEDLQQADPIQQEALVSIRDVLIGKPIQYTAAAHFANRTGKASGMLIGGNLKTIEALAGSGSDLRTDGKILFLEDAGEYLYSIDRMFWNLKRAGKLEHLKGLIIGGFRVKASEDPEEEFGKTLQEIVMEKVAHTNFPVCFDFPTGHQKNNFALKCGVTYQLQVRVSGTTLTEIT